MPTTPNEASARMIRALSVAEPDLDTSVGTPVRKIIDVFAEAIAEHSVDTHLLSYQYDIDTRRGADLDAWVAMFGFARRAARVASGTVVLQRTRALDANIRIPSGTQMSTSKGSGTPVVVQTTGTAVFPRNAYSIEVPVRAIVGGTAGNVAAGAINRLLTSVSGVQTVTNPAALTGGSNAESDKQLRQRFKRTLFRNLAGTEDMFLAVALDDIDVVSARIFGPTTAFQERIQTIGGTATSSITPLDDPMPVRTVSNADPIQITTRGPHGLVEDDTVYVSGVGGTTSANGLFRVGQVVSEVAFTLRTATGATVAGNGAYTSGGNVYRIVRLDWSDPQSGVFGRNIDDGDIAAPFLWTFSGGTSLPTATVGDVDEYPDGVYDLRYRYQSQATRNNYVTALGAQNKVDVWVYGSREKSVTETTIITGGSANLFTTSQPSPMSISRFRRNNGSLSVAGNLFARLAFCPIAALPNTIKIGTKTLVEGVDYWLTRDQRMSVCGAPDSSEGLEISAAAVRVTALPIVSSTNASPIVVNVGSGHLFVTGQKVRVAGHAVNTSANGVWNVSAITSTTITLEGSVGTAIGANTGTVTLAHPLSIKYVTNRVPLAVQRNAERWRLVTSDVSVHQARPLALKIHAAAILQPGFNINSVRASVQGAISNLLNEVGIGSILQISDLTSAMSRVSGVDAVRLLNSSDMTRLTISAATNASPIQITTGSTPHGFEVGDLVQIDGAAGNTSANGVWRVASVPSSTTLTLANSSGNGSYTSGGQIFSADYAIQIIEPDGVTPRTVRASRGSAPYRALDLVANDGEVFTLHSLVLENRAQNNWGVS